MIRNLRTHQVFEFTRSMRQAYDSSLTDRELVSLRSSLIMEEAGEVFDELQREEVDPERLTKELCDLLYVTIGCAVAFGLPLDDAFERVHESNMSKLGPDGRPTFRDDGKVLKPPTYKKPDLSDLF